MNKRDIIDMLRERRALERVAASIGRQSAPEPEWGYVLVAIADRLSWSAYALSVLDPQLVDRAEAILNAEAQPVFTPKDWAAAWTKPH